MQARRRSLGDGELVAGRTEAGHDIEIGNRRLLSFDYTSAVNKSASHAPPFASTSHVDPVRQSTYEDPFHLGRQPPAVTEWW
jgi:hypothetical protein